MRSAAGKRGLGAIVLCVSDPVSFATILAMACRAALCILVASLLFSGLLWGQQAPAASSARTLLLPKRIVTGERATLAVLDGSGRLTPGVIVELSSGGQVVTDATGRASFGAPANPGVIYATIGKRQERVYTTILTHQEAPATPTRVSLVPRISSLADRFELSGSGFCGQADENRVQVGGKAGLVLASSPAYLIVLPPEDLAPGTSPVEISCGQQSSGPFSVSFVELSVEANSSPLAPGEHRALTVRIHGSDSKVPLQARNLAPAVASLAGGNGGQIASTGGADNIARFDLIGKARGSFAVAIQVVPDFMRIGDKP
jgi:hypothetical protein